MVDKKEEVKEQEEKWSVKLSIVDEKVPPERVVTDGELTMDLYEAVALILNNQEKLKGLLN